MNEQLQLLARIDIKKGLAQLPEGHQKLFKRMYSPHKPDAWLSDVVDAMPESKLDMALQQVQRSLEKVKS